MSRNVETALADCLAKLERNELTLDDALDAYPELTLELEPLLTLAMELRSMPKPEVPEALRSSKRPVFAPAAPAPRRLLPWNWRVLLPTPAWTAPVARLAAGFALAAMLLGGTMVASASSLPEEPLYPVKLAMENVQLALTSSPQQRSELEIQLAGRRLQEVESAAQQGKLQAVQQGLTLYEQRVQSAVDQAQTVGTPSQETQIQGSLEQQQEVLARVYDQVPATAQQAILHAMEVSQRGETLSGKKADGDGDKVKEQPKAPAVSPTTPVPTRVVPSEMPGKGHESPSKAKVESMPPETADPTAAVEENRGNGRRVDGAPGREKEASGMGPSGDPEPNVEGSSRPVLPTPQPWRISSQDSRSGSPTPTASSGTATPPPIASVGGVVLPSVTAEPERNRQDGGRGRDARPSTSGSDNGTDDDKGKSDRDREPSSRGGSRGGSR